MTYFNVCVGYLFKPFCLLSKTMNSNCTSLLPLSLFSLLSSYSVLLSILTLDLSRSQPSQGNARDTNVKCIRKCILQMHFFRFVLYFVWGLSWRQRSWGNARDTNVKCCSEWNCVASPPTLSHNISNVHQIFLKSQSDVYLTLLLSSNIIKNL